MVMIYIALVGLCFGSFVNALVYRVHEQAKDQKPKTKNQNSKLSILHGRSMCPHCRHQLGAKDLLPLASWLVLRGKCRYCKKPISRQYPVVEATTAVLFVISYFFWPYELAGTGAVTFILWLCSLVGLVSLAVYDIKWMLLPNRIIFPLYGLAVLYVCALTLQQDSISVLVNALFGVLIGGGLFYLLFMTSNGRWIGGGDVKLGFLIGALAGSALQSLLMLFLASLFGTLCILPLLASGKITRKARIPFGPFLIASCIVVVLFGKSLTTWYLDLFL